MRDGIRAIIGKHGDIRRLESDWVSGKEISLPQGYGMIFLTDALLESIAELFEAEHEPSDPETVTDWLLQEYSFRTRLACLEADYMDGIGSRSGVLYENGKIRLAPRSGEEAVNILLRELGVWCKEGQDEFDSLHLGIYRRMDKWPR